MKNIIKSFFLITLVLSIFSCDDNETSDLISNEELGWVQFMEDSDDIISLTQGDSEELTLDLNIQVPKTNSDLTVNYNLISVSGLDPNTYFGTSTIVPEGVTSWVGPDNSTGSEYAGVGEIKFDLSKLPVLTESMTFDVELTSTSSSTVSIGIDGESIKTIQRISVLCNRLPLAPSAPFVGSYSIVVSPAGVFGAAIFESQTVTLSGTGSTKTFDAVYLEGLGIGQAAMTFTFDFASCGAIIVAGEQQTNLACGGVSATLGADTLLGTYDTNDDNTFTVNATEFDTVACGVDVPSPFTIVFTKI